LCNYVFGAVFIDRDGEVYACCHKQPQSYGNVCRSPLTTILATPAVVHHQEQSRAGGLACFTTCNLLNFNEKMEHPPYGHDRSIYPAIAKLTLSLGWFCNVNCVMCPQDHAERRFLPVNVLRDHVDWERVDEVICEGGEPLAAPTAHALWDMLIARGKKVNFVTNGLILTGRTIAKLTRHSDYLYISFNAATRDTYTRVVRGGSWDRLMRGLRLVQEARAADASPLKIIGHFTIVEDNLHEIAAFIDLAAALDLDIVNFGYNRIAHMGACIDELLRNDDWLRRTLADEIRGASSRVNTRVAIDPSRLQYLGLVEPGDPLWDRVVYPSGM
jgi:MoaA/NifB/PqqE/SkfB family radical SAM enzyme